MMRRLQRLYTKWIIWRNLDSIINRRATVENYLFQAAAGEKPLPDEDKCRELALKLGKPQ